MMGMGRGGSVRRGGDGCDWWPLVIDVAAVPALPPSPHSPRQPRPCPPSQIQYIFLNLPGPHGPCGHVTKQVQGNVLYSTSPPGHHGPMQASAQTAQAMRLNLLCHTC